MRVAVLAVFGYPSESPDAACRAIRFGQALVAIGNDVLGGWVGELNAKIETGTRVALATGHIWPINIGARAVEIALFGDTINLAARLEKNCTVDRLLLDHRTNNAAAKADPKFVSSLGLEQIEVPVENAKGQAYPVKAWLSS
jgi:class 3 adenylate cyclase